MEGADPPLIGETGIENASAGPDLAAHRAEQIAKVRVNAFLGLGERAVEDINRLILHEVGGEVEHFCGMFTQVGKRCRQSPRLGSQLDRDELLQPRARRVDLAVEAVEFRPIGLLALEVGFGRRAAREATLMLEQNGQSRCLVDALNAALMQPFACCDHAT